MQTKRDRQDLHGLDDDGMLLCNPRDREAAHRAQVERIATEDIEAVTCRKCRALMRRQGAREPRARAPRARPRVV